MAKISKPKAAPKKIAKLSGEDEVKKFMTQLGHPLKTSVELLRKIILDANPKLTEQIKWNAPSFCFNGDDRVTFNIHKKDCVLLIFHRGAKSKDSKSKSHLFEDATGLLEWLSGDRAVAKFISTDDVTSKKAKLKKVVNQWIEATG